MIVPGFADLLLQVMIDTKLSRMGIGWMPTILLYGLIEPAGGADPKLTRYIAEKGAMLAFKAVKAKQAREHLNADFEYQVGRFECHTSTRLS